MQYGIMVAMIQRIQKQITYGIGWLVVAVGVISLISFLSTGSSRQQARLATPTPSLTPIILEGTDVIRHEVKEGENKTIDLVTRLRNPNPSAGIAEYEVTYVLQDVDGQEITTRREKTYILPSSAQHVIALNISLGSKNLANVETKLPQAPTFITLPPTMSRASLGAFPKQRVEQVIGSRVLEEQSGIVKNNSTFEWRTVEVQVLGVSQEDEIVAASKTTIGALKVGEEREFKVVWPKPTTPVTRLVLLPTTNIYLDENIIKTIGDPSLLK